jgi:hypothetical protein
MILQPFLPFKEGSHINFQEGFPGGYWAMKLWQLQMPQGGPSFARGVSMSLGLADASTIGGRVCQSSHSGSCFFSNFSFEP